MYKIYTRIGFSTNRQTFNKYMAKAEKSPIFTSPKSYTKPLGIIKTVEHLCEKLVFKIDIKIKKI